jgi:hypothetical protein
MRRAGTVAAVSTVVVGSVGAARTLMLSPGELPIVAGALAFAVVGALLMHRRPENPVGWLLGLYGVLFCVQLAFYEEVYRYQATGEASSVLGLNSVIYAVGWLLGFGVLALAVLLFPTGRLPSRRWRPVGALASAGGCAVVVAAVLLWPQRGPGLLDGGIVPPGAGGVVFAFAMIATYPALVLALASLAVRYRRAAQEERLQLKWLLFAVVFLISGPLYFLVTRTGPGVDGAEIGELLTITGMFGVPVTIGIAITKHRLYEIDRLISRTVAYAALTGVLGGVYVGGVFVLTPLLAAVGSGSQLAVAASTLVVAAAFGPVRRHVQEAVDRRFNRSRYDAVRTVEAFRERLRNEVDLTGLSEEMLAVVQRAVDPAEATLWLRPGSEAR